jgi:lipopolysaccharide/colanic/teichoic acid biosynthesis glycosyltransferase
MTFAQVPAPASSHASNATISASRIVDVIAGCAGLFISGPVMLLVAFAIWLESGRPILFIQTRLGRGGEHFPMYKFRKFHGDIGTDGCGVTLHGDRRMTRIGRFLARTKLDELPQFWNVIRGDLSIVGPRAESLKFADCFTRDYRDVLAYKPGLFGPNQFYFRDEGSLYPERSDPERFYRDVLFPLKARIDLAYFSHRTVAADIGWIIGCVLAVLGPRRLRVNVNATFPGWLDRHASRERVEIQAP